MADAYGAGLLFRNFLGQAVPAVGNAAANALLPVRPVVQVAAPTIRDFLSGAINGPQNSVTVALPEARPAPKTPAPAKAPAAPAKVTPDPLGALGKLSFRQLLTLSQASENLAPKGSTRTPSATDQAGAALAQIYQQQFKASIDAAGKDPAKQQAAIDAFEKKMLPIALKGNTADEYLYGDQ